MDNTVIVALIGSAGSALVAVTALGLNYRGFTSLENRMTALENRITGFEGRVDARLSLMHSTISSLLTDVALLKDRAGL